MRSFRRTRGVRALVVCVFLSGITAVANPAVAAAAGGPSVELPAVPSVPVSEQWVQNRPADEATVRALKNDQQAGGATPAGQGTSKATPLSPSATWDVSLRTGDFNWSYPLKVPPSPGGLVPDLSLSYSSSAVDGRTSVTNNQPSWVGDGWSLSPGFIERTYGTCSEDTEGGTTPPTDAADLCWRSDNAIASSGAGGGQLIRDDASGVWRPKNDDGSRVERIYESGKGDADGEYWKITSTDGTQYFYGIRPESNSVWTVPVFGDDVNEPCHGDTFDASSCNQAWRWNLDKVVDRHGNSIIYTYETETNSYGFNRQNAAVSYIRGGTLARAEYGMREGTADRPTGKIVFTPTDRCVPNSTCTPDKKENWPDVPWDDKCDTATCAHRHWPTFWSTKRLDSVVTWVWRGSEYDEVDSWKLEHQYPDPNSGEKAALWLRSIQRTGLVNGSFPLPPVVFEGTPLANRVDSGDAVGALKRYRVTGVISEAGGLTTVNYATDCSPTSLPQAAHNNTKRCYPSTWKPPFASTERTDYFHKYVVDTVVTSDRLAQNGSDPEHPIASTEQLVRYEYLDGAAWHFNDSEFSKDDKKTWDEFRGYGRVRVHTGKPFDPGGAKITMTEQRFYRGMDGDRQPSGTRPETVTDSDNVARPDSDWLQGFVLESRTHKGETDEVIDKTINTPVSKETAARNTATGGTYRAHFVGTKTSRSYTALASGGWRETQTDTTYDDYGRVTKIDDLGDKATAMDDRCTTTTYVDNTTKWLMAFPSRVETVTVHCGATPVFPQNALSDTMASYDEQEPGRPPITGNVTRQEILKERPAAKPEYVVSRTATYDAFGRPLTVADVLGRTTTMAYEQADGGGPTTKTTVTNEVGHAVTTMLEPAWGVPLKSTDPNGDITENAYDGLGRVVETWLPNRRSDLNSNRGNVRYSYQVRNDGPTVVTTTSIGPNGNYVSSNTLYDPQYRPRQVQVPTQGGRLLTDTRYDSQGRVYKTTQPYFNEAPVDAKLWVASDTEVPGLAFTEFDDAGRPTASIYKAGANEKWRTTTTYGGDRVSVTPPQGGTPTTTITDARGQTTELWQYKGTDAVGDHDTTRYTYTLAGRLASSTDPAGNTWRWSYDLRGRQIKAEDVDKGTSTSTFDDANQLLSVTDARGLTLAYGYDRLGRPTTVREGGPTGVLRSEMTYDTVLFAKGKLATATRYVGGNAYTQRIDSYGLLGGPTRVSVVIPPSEGVLQGTYTTLFGYTFTGSLASIVYAKAGPMPREDMYFRRDDQDRPTKSWANYNTQTVDLVTERSYTRYGEPQRTYLGKSGKKTWLSSYYDTNTRRLNRTIVDAELPAPMQSDVNYTHDPAGNITSIKDDSPGSPERHCYNYDYLRRLTEAWTPAGDCSSSPSTSSLSGPAPYWQSFTYDSVGNRRTETQHASAGDTTRTYTYPPTGHALQSVDTQGPAVSKLDEFGYDAAGNTTRRKLTSGDQTLDWDIEGRLSKVTESGKTTSFIYDASGARLVRKDPTGTTVYLGGQELRLDSASATVTGTRYYSFGDSAVAMRTATTPTTSELTWLAGDHQGTAQIAVNAATMAVTRRRQTPFGAPRGQGVTFPGEKGFVGGTIDSSIGLTTLGARQYDPTTGRFISVDPIMNKADPQSWNAYIYANNSPVTSSDPTGLAREDKGSNCVIRIGGCDMEKPAGYPSSPGSNATGGASGSTRATSKYDAPAKRKGRKPTSEEIQEFRNYDYEGSDDYTLRDAVNWAQQSKMGFDVYCNEVVESDPEGCGKDVAELFPEIPIGDVIEGMASFGYQMTPVADVVSCAQGDCLGLLFSLVPQVKVLRKLDNVSEGASAAAKNCKNSFVPGTLVLMADGTSKPIEELQAGDVVLATDPETGETGPREVLAPISDEGTKNLVHITFDTDGVAGDQTGAFTATDNHPFWAPELRKWVTAGELRAGSLLLTSAGAKIHVTTVRKWTADQRVHNLTVDDIHTYYVVAGNTPVLVHNNGPFCGRPFGRNTPGHADFHGSGFSLDEIAGFVHGHTGGGNPAMGRPSYSEIEATLRNAGPNRIKGQNSARLEHNGVRVIVNYDKPWRSTAYYPGR